MEFDNNNTISMGMNIDAEIMVNRNTQEFHYLYKAFICNTIIKAPMKHLDYDGDFIVIGYGLGDDGIATFDLKATKHE